MVVGAEIAIGKDCVSTVNSGVCARLDDGCDERWHEEELEGFQADLFELAPSRLPCRTAVKLLAQALLSAHLTRHGRSHSRRSGRSARGDEAPSASTHPLRSP